MTRITDIGTGICWGVCGDDARRRAAGHRPDGSYVTNQGYHPDCGHGYPLVVDTTRVGSVKVYAVYEKHITSVEEPTKQWGRWHAQQWKLVLETLADPEKLLLLELSSI